MDSIANNNKPIAPDSSKIKKARKKLIKQFNEEAKQVTPKALQKMAQAIRTWISRHSEERINLRDKTFRLFDGNKHPAKTRSTFVKEMMGTLGSKTPESDHTSSLAGRVQKQSD